MEPIFLIVDLFCGAGGTSTGFAMAELEGNKIAKVIACVNHDPKAIKSHWLNHPEVKHFEEDIRTLDLTELINVVKFQRSLYSNAKLILWASLECTNFSKAKGGQPRDADSRTLADHLERYILAIDPDYVQIENVVEFMSWGPLDDRGKPVSKKTGRDWMRWKKEICDMGYTDEWKELNSANFGAYTSRNRLFGCFTKTGNVSAWPEPTHAKNPSKNSMHGDLQKWMPVKEVLDFADEGESIFTRKKPLSDKTLERIYAGLIKYVAKGDTAFITKYFSGRPAGKVIPVDGPAGTIKTADGQSLVQPISILKYNSTDKNGKHYPPSVDEPAPVVTTHGRLGLVQGEFLTHYFQNGFNTSVNDPLPTITTKDRAGLVQPQYLVNYHHSSNTNDVNDPAPTLTTRDKLSLIQPEFFIDKHYGKYSQNQSINDPAGTILPTDKHRLIECDPLKVQVNCDCGNSWIAKEDSYLKEACSKCGGFSLTITFLRPQPFLMPTNFDNKPKSIEEPAPTITANRKHHYIVNPSHGGHSSSVDVPCPVIIARQDKAPLYFVQVEIGSVAIAVFDTDTEICIKIKQFMAVFGLIDIKMRMLRVLELLKIQGFPEDYKLEGNQADQKKFIGNSVHPLVVKYWAEALGRKLAPIIKLKSVTSKKKVA